MELHPAAHYRTTLRRGDRGTDVAALQINLAVFTDGVYGAQTTAAVSDVQKQERLLVDGVAGPATQRKLCLRLSQGATDHYKLPKRLLEGCMENESGFAIACYSEHPSDTGFDLGPYQDSIEPGKGSQARYVKAYNAASMALDTGRKYRTQYDLYRRRGVESDRAWRLAVLYHNWPWAADRLSRGLSVGWDNRAGWVEQASGGRLHTNGEWITAYITRVIKYCPELGKPS